MLNTSRHPPPSKKKDGAEFRRMRLKFLGYISTCFVTKLKDRITKATKPVALYYHLGKAVTNREDVGCRLNYRKTNRI